MMCRILSKFYGRDTRAVQLASFVVSLMWFLAIVADNMGFIDLYMPEPLQDHHYLTCFFSTSAIFTFIGFCTQGKAHQVFKAFGLAVGALSQAIIANGYVNSYPPLDIMIAVSTILSLVFFGAVYYILRCEGKYGLHRSTL